MRYKDHKLGTNVEDVLGAFYGHPGEADKKPFGFDVHQGFEFFLHSDNRLYKKGPGTMTPLTLAEEVEMRENLALGAVELYLRRPTSGLPPYSKVEKIILHAATGTQLPEDGEWELEVTATEQELLDAGITSYCQQVCGGCECGTGPACQYGIDPVTEMPAKK